MGIVQKLKDKVEEMEDKLNPYCIECENCGEDGCCSYLNCITNAMSKNKNCKYSEIYKNELLLRDEFYKAILKDLGNNQVVSEIFDSVYDKINKKL